MISLLAAAAALSPKFVSFVISFWGAAAALLSPFMISLLAAALSPSWCPFVSPQIAGSLGVLTSHFSMAGFLIAEIGLSPKLVFPHDFALGCRDVAAVSHDFPSGAALGCRLPPCPPSL